MSHHSQKIELKQHIQKVRDAQHERLIHLLVTLTVAQVAIALIITFSFTHNWLLGCAAIICLCLLVAYLMHYRKLENQVQSWYTVTDTLFKNMKDIDEKS